MARREIENDVRAKTETETETETETNSDLLKTIKDRLFHLLHTSERLKRKPVLEEPNIF